MRPDVADRRVERVDDVKEPDPPGGAGEGDLAGEPLAGRERVEREVGRAGTRAKLRSDDGEPNVAFEGLAGSLFELRVHRFSDQGALKKCQASPRSKSRTDGLAPLAL